MSDVARPTNNDSGLLQEFSEVAESISGTTKKLAKAAFIAEYFQKLHDADLARAARYFAGHQFALADERTTNVGGSIITTALCQATGFSIEDLLPKYVRLGDAGEAAFEAIKEAKHSYREPSITLAETESIITRLSEARGSKSKTAILTTVLQTATPLEGKYLVKLLVRDLRIGLREGLVEDSIARAFDQPLERVADANMLLGDIGETA